ncbi:NAD(P)H-dependent FMN reductase [Lactobacillus colini]|uniref:NAD(P)H-dependent FMN reductase n=1 Tax=Lactobacillus colini TaxID=1819254 RepID=A0ABS4MEP6_9LACO|nr:NADPH-dependent FMN reductase [Lactobacillus colini]MBP2058160.1 NAD(P)H-dependent FMN reductase [Lactobacillus colini]
MKLLAVVGTNADFSFNRLLQQFMAKRYSNQAEIEVYEIAQLPKFKKDAEVDKTVVDFREKIRQADGVIFSTPEYDHGIPAALKNAMEWTGEHAPGNGDVFRMKPSMVIGASYGIQGATRAQEDMREILLSPDLGSNVLPGNEVLVSHVADKFNKETGELTDPADIEAIDAAFENFIKFIKHA